MSKNWEVCRPGFRPGRWFAPQATMDRRGVIKLSRVAWELLNCCEHAIVLFDRETQTIGIKPQRAPITDTQPFVESGKHGARTVNALALQHQFNVPLDTTIRFANPVINEEGILELSLTTARPAYHGRRVGAFHRERKRSSGS